MEDFTKKHSILVHWGPKSLRYQNNQVIIETPIELKNKFICPYFHFVMIPRRYLTPFMIFSVTCAILSLALF